MSLSDLASVTVSVDGAGLKEKGFGTIGLLAYHTLWPELSRAVTELSELTAAGVAAKHPVYRMCSRAFAQSPRPESVKVLKMTTPHVQVQRLVPVYAASTTYKITIETLTGAKIEVSAASGANLAASCTNLANAITALGYAEIASATGASGTYVDVTSTSGQIVFMSGWDPALLRYEDRTPAPAGVATMLDAIVNYDDDFYGLAVDCNAKAIIEAVADWAETRLMLVGYNTSDWTARDPANSTDIGSILMAKSYNRDIGIFKENDTSEYGGVGLLAERFPFDPGAGQGGGTFHAQTIAGITPDKLTPSVKTAIRNKRIMPYITTAGVNHTLDGKVPSGEFADVTRGRDWIQVRLQERLAALALSGQRTPFTDAGISKIYSAVSAVMNEAVTPAEILAADPAPAVTVPKASAVSTADKNARRLTGVKATGTLAGAIHFTTLTVNISK